MVQMQVGKEHIGDMGMPVFALKNSLQYSAAAIKKYRTIFFITSCIHYQPGLHPVLLWYSNTGSQQDNSHLLPL